VPPQVPMPPFGPMMPRMPWETILPVFVGVLGAIALLGILWAIVGIIVRYTSFGALIGMVNQVEEVEQTTFQSGLRIGWGRLLHLFVIHLIIAIVGIIFAIALAIIFIIGGILAAMPAILLFNVSDGAGVVGILLGVAIGIGLLLFLILLALVFTIAATIVRELAFRASVLEGRGIFESIGAGITLLRTRLGETLLTWLLLAAIRLVLGIVAIPLALVGMAIILIPAFLAFGITESPLVALFGAAPGLILFILVAAFLGGLVLVFYSATWTLVFRELQFGDMRYQAV
jgi:hypothetical protein